MLVILSFIYFVGLAMLIKVAKYKKSSYALLKGGCSGLFLWVGLYSGWNGAVINTKEYYLLLTALVLCALGDVLLGVANRHLRKVRKKPFLLGAISFSLAHVVFCVMLYSLHPFSWYLFIVPVLLCALLQVLEKYRYVKLKSMRLFATVYAYLVGLMSLSAFTLVTQEVLPAPGKYLLAIGSLLFLISDCILLFLYFGTRRNKYDRSLNLITYYIGIFMIATSAVSF